MSGEGQKIVNMYLGSIHFTFSTSLNTYLDCKVLLQYFGLHPSELACWVNTCIQCEVVGSERWDLKSLVARLSLWPSTHHIYSSRVVLLP